jgi:hypothetical protein
LGGRASFTGRYDKGAARSMAGDLAAPSLPLRRVSGSVGAGLIAGDGSTDRRLGAKGRSGVVAFDTTGSDSRRLSRKGDDASLTGSLSGKEWTFVPSADKMKVARASVVDMLDALTFEGPEGQAQRAQVGELTSPQEVHAHLQAMDADHMFWGKRGGDEAENAFDLFGGGAGGLNGPEAELFDLGEEIETENWKLRQKFGEEALKWLGIAINADERSSSSLLNLYLGGTAAPVAATGGVVSGEIALKGGKRTATLGTQVGRMAGKYPDVVRIQTTQRMPSRAIALFSVSLEDSHMHEPKRGEHGARRFPSMEKRPHDIQELPRPALVAALTSKGARKLMSDAFTRLDYKRGGRITLDMMTDRLGLPQYLAAEMFARIGVGPTDSLTRRDMTSAATSLVRDMDALGRTVADYGAVATALRLAAMGVWGVIVVFVALWAFEVSLLSVIVPIGLLFTSLSFAAGEPAKIFFMSLFALTVYAPFECGDKVILDNSRVLTVSKIEVCATWFRNAFGREMMVSNHRLINMGIENFRRCQNASVELLFTIGYRTSPRQFDAMVSAMLAYVRNYSNRWMEENVDCLIKDGTGVDGDIKFVVWLKHKKSWMEGMEVMTDSSRFIFFSLQTMRRLGIEHIRSAQPVILADPIGQGQEQPAGASSGGPIRLRRSQLWDHDLTAKTLEEPSREEENSSTDSEAPPKPKLGEKPRSNPSSRRGSVDEDKLPRKKIHLKHDTPPAQWMDVGQSLVHRVPKRATDGSKAACLREAFAHGTITTAGDEAATGFDSKTYALGFEPPMLGAAGKTVGSTPFDERQASGLRRRLALSKAKEHH